MHKEAAELSTALQSGFIKMTAGQNFLLARTSQTRTTAVVVLPPFAEEMNKTRHLINAVMHQLTVAGCSSFMLDNYGTGDSEGDLDQTTVSLWRDDICQLLQLLQQHGYQSVSFIAIRFGTLQLFDLLNSSTLPLPVQKVVLWQPMFDAAKFWQQFVRIKVAEVMATGHKISQKELEQQLETGQSIEIAGYPISPAFYASIKSTNTNFPDIFKHTALSWFETSLLDTVALPVQKMQQHLAQITQLNFVQFKAEPYWQTTELASADSLIASTAQQLTGDRR